MKKYWLTQLCTGSQGDLNVNNDVINFAGSDINLNANGNIAQNADIMTLGKGNITVETANNINMQSDATLNNGVKTQTEGGIIQYNAAQDLELTSLVSNGFGGFININANNIVDGLNGDNLSATILNVQSPSLTDGQDHRASGGGHR